MPVFHLKLMEDVTLDDVRRMLECIETDDLKQMTSKPVSKGALMEAKILVEKISIQNLQKVLPRRLSKQMTNQVLAFAYKNDRKFFDFLFDVLKGLSGDHDPDSQRAYLSSTAELRIKGPYKVASGCTLRDYEPKLLEYGRNVFAIEVILSSHNYFAVFEKGGSVISEMWIGNERVIPGNDLNACCVMDITRFLVDGYNSFRLSVCRDELFAVVPLEHLSDEEMLCVVLNNKPYLKGGTCLDEVEFPVRGIRCQHSDVFDLLDYVRNCEISREWKCPVCGQDTPFTELALDSTVYEQRRSSLFGVNKFL